MVIKNMGINRYSKPSKHLLKLKQDFFDNNDTFLSTSRKINNIYIKQPLRERCMNCDHAIDIENDKETFIKQGVTYGICQFCGHLNGFFEDSDEFCQTVYTDDDGESYGKIYNASKRQEYFNRVADIYTPKAEFLLESLSSLADFNSLNYVDFGAGSGYFVSALVEAGVNNIVGYEVSRTQADSGNIMIGKDLLKVCSIEDTISIIKSIDSDVVSMIGVLEHVQKPKEILDALRSNTNIRFLYLSVPLFSPCVFFEMVFPEVMQRQLSGGHTHLYTESSLKWLENEFDMKKVSAWWYGTDMVDLYRNITVQLKRESGTRKMVKAWERMFIPLIDSMQSKIDKKHLASEVHMLFEFKN
jgi:2-polyprenyl-3-methyl-5-hydroxy-6-metoxy-1,4-benzoquinol methylase